MKTFFSLMLIIATASPLFALSRKTAGMSAAVNLSFLFDSYKKDNGRLPKSWQEFSEGGYRSGGVWETAERLLDMENRYAFVEIKPLRIGPETVRIFLMAKQPGAEGNNFETSEMDRFEGRLTLIEDEDGRPVVRKYTEKTLKLSFEKAGLDLADYTFDAPRSPSYNLGKEIAVYFRVRPWLKNSCLIVLLCGGVLLWRKLRNHRDLPAD